MNRLKVMRKIKHKTQSEVANYMNVSQNTYSYWESGKINVDASSLEKLASYFKVSLDFLSGRKYYLQRPFDCWREDQKEDYINANEFEKEYLEFLYGNPNFGDTFSTTISNNVVGDNNTNCCNSSPSGATLGDIEKELVSLCSKMDMKQKNALLSKAYELLDK